MKILIIYNPNSGRGKGAKIATRLEKRLNKLRTYECCLHASKNIADFYEYSASNKNNPHGYTLAIIIGGDGTLSICVDAMVKNNFIIPIYAFGGGTANDFPSYMKTNKSVRRACKIIMNNPKKCLIDTLRVIHENNEQEPYYAINVACGGAFTNGVTKYNRNGKKLLGKLYYMLKSAQSAITMQGQQTKITIDDMEYKENIYLFLILNTTNAGSIKSITRDALPWDGLLDIVAIRKCGFFSKIGLSFSILFRRLYKNKNVFVARGKTVQIEIIGDPNPNFIRTDIDGNVGYNFPMKVEPSDNTLEFIINR
ncbi:MAG: hypothetical protein FWE16_04455 [Firmicutes bacterium]|nr:hypothetical protein [Bacillota bacterium]